MIYIDEIIEFTNRRFPIDCNWLNGNCYFYAKILKSAFPKGKIYYDVINCHFVFKYKNNFYDWTGIVKPDGYLVKWKSFNKYDPLQKQVIIRDCIM